MQFTFSPLKCLIIKIIAFPVRVNEFNERSQIYNSNRNLVQLESKVEFQPHSFVSNSMSAIISRDKRHVA